MNTINRLTLLAALFAMSLAAQPSINVSSLSAAVNSSATTITVASATGITATTTAIRVDDELMAVLSVSSTRIGVMRGAYGTKASAHGAGVATYAAPLASFNHYGSAWGHQFASTLFYPSVVPTTVTTAGAATYTVGAVKGGLILDDPNGAARTRTLPTAALLVAATPGAMVNSTMRLLIRNDADAAETITVAVGTGGTGSGTLTIAQNNTKEFLIRFTAVTPGAEAYTLYSIGTYVH